MIQIRCVTHTDIPHIQSIAREAWLYTYDGIYSQEFIHDFTSKAYSTENLSRSVELDIQRDQRQFLIAEYHDEIVGYAQTMYVNEETYELVRIYVRPGFHHLGIGKAFLAELIQGLKPIRKLFAWVAQENQLGRSFYEKRGFREVEKMEETIEGNPKTQIKYELEIKVEQSAE